ncbi:hypothetical protein MATL_G00175970 [Megalops atlanticus]|uniref:Ig-like domain-containing protein n=1 Tax=Megalops atlanticus TaxID=7932 RepID=A0A9D3T1W5_MEGAT|nr:hypothetical protein MATL_G00175970 [Megalops atlanticus]
MLRQSKLAVTSSIRYLIFTFGITAVVSTESVRTKQIVTATLGHNVILSCELTDPKTVMQVTWQKMTSNSVQNVATYSKRFGAKVKHPFRKHVQLEDGVQKSSLLIRGVSRDHESCYKCLFNTYPEGAVSGTTCLKVYGAFQESRVEPYREFQESIAEPYRSGGLSPVLSSIIVVTGLCTHSVIYQIY